MAARRVISGVKATFCWASSPPIESVTGESHAAFGVLQPAVQPSETQRVSIGPWDRLFPSMFLKIRPVSPSCRSLRPLVRAVARRQVHLSARAPSDRRLPASTRNLALSFPADFYLGSIVHVRGDELLPPMPYDRLATHVPGRPRSYARWASIFRVVDAFLTPTRHHLHPGDVHESGTDADTASSWLPAPRSGSFRDCGRRVTAPVHVRLTPITPAKPA